ncbi:putative regulatory protein LuxR, partial [Mycobacterium kansasii 662]
MTAPLRYARNGDVRLAYRVFGDTGPFLIWVSGWVLSNVDTIDEPGSPYAEFIDRVSQSTRLIVWDRRGTGLSDPSTQPLSLDQRIDDVRAILDAAGAAGSIPGHQRGWIGQRVIRPPPTRNGLRPLFFTALRRGIPKSSPTSRGGSRPAEIESQLDEIDDRWGEGALADLFYSATADTSGVRAMFGKLQRAIASPTMAKLWWKAFMEIGRPQRPGLGAGTDLVFARPGDRLVPSRRPRPGRAIPEAHFQPLAAGSPQPLRHHRRLCAVGRGVRLRKAKRTTRRANPESRHVQPTSS